MYSYFNVLKPYIYLFRNLTILITTVLIYLVNNYFLSINFILIFINLVKTT